MTSSWVSDRSRSGSLRDEGADDVYYGAPPNPYVNSSVDQFIVAWYL